MLAAAGENTAMRFDGVTVDPGTQPAAYLASGWINGLIEGSIRTVSLHGLPVATAEAAAGDWVFRIGVVGVGGSMYRIIYADRNDGAAIQRALESTLASFHRMTPTEVARLRPLRLDVIAAREGETVGDLAVRMHGTERKLQLLRLLNGLEASDSLTTGQLVKVVID